MDLQIASELSDEKGYKSKSLMWENTLRIRHSEEPNFFSEHKQTPLRLTRGASSVGADLEKPVNDNTVIFTTNILTHK